MKSYKLYLTGMLLITSVLANFAYAKPTMAVLDFRNTSSAYWWYSGVGRDLAGMLTNELASGKKFSMVERQKLSGVLREQDLAAGGRVSASTGAKIGKMTGAQYLVTATVTSFEQDVQKTGGGISYKGISLGGKRKSAYIAVDLRVVDSSTGEIVDTRTVEARSKGAGINLGIFRDGFGGRLANEKKTPAGKAIRAMVMEISEYLECSLVTKGSCMASYEAKERKRRDSLREQIQLD